MTCPVHDRVYYFPVNGTDGKAAKSNDNKSSSINAINPTNNNKEDNYHQHTGGTFLNHPASNTGGAHGHLDDGDVSSSWDSGSNVSTALLPSAPRNVQVLQASNRFVMLSWRAPEHNSGSVTGQSRESCSVM